MNAVTKVLLAVAGLIVVVFLCVLFWTIGSYNGLVSARQATDAQWAQVQNVYQRRADLVPNLVNTVAGAANFEKSTLTAVTNARASVGRVNISGASAPTDAKQLAAFDQAQGQLGTALSRLLVVSENYPTLKASANFMGLQAQLEGTENRIAVERGRFNEAVQMYDTAIQRFPGVIIAGIFHFESRPYFAAAPSAATPPTVDFNGKF